MGLIQELQRADAQRRKEVAALAHEVASRLSDFRKDDAQRRRGVAAMTSEVSAMRANAKAFVGQLHQTSAHRRSQVGATCAEARGFVNHLHQISHDRRSEVAAMSKNVAAMRAGHRAFVRRLEKLGADRHVQVWGKTAPVAKAASPQAVHEPVPFPQTTATMGQPTVTLRDVIFTYLAEHPDGAKLTQLEQDLGMSRIQIAQAMRGLIDENKVEKRELLYFAL